MKKPDSTYRLQLSPDFPFAKLDKILDYLNDLGISTIYSAPFFQAREGSTHGYDVIDPFTLNKEIGTLEEFKAIRGRLNEKEMSWLQDIVPNHMAFDPANPWLKSIFELGPLSRFYNFFDIDWKYMDLGKVMAPFLGKPLEEVVDNRELQLQLGKQGVSFNYYETSYPVSVKTYHKILNHTKDDSWREKFQNFDGTEEQWQKFKNSFLKDLEANRNLKSTFNTVINDINSSDQKLFEILDLQYFLPTYWKKTEEEINFRRFFTINDLICLRMEDPDVFKTYHRFIKQMCEMGLINGLRIDHIDGLFDPGGYLENLRKMLGDEFYIIVEKILEADETLPKQWPVQGTSGYEFLAQINHLFTRSSSEEAFNEAYEKISPKLSNYEGLVYKKKMFILKKRMGGELKNLWEILKTEFLDEKTGHRNKEVWKEALSAFLAAFPVYRIYPDKFPLDAHQSDLIEQAYTKAQNEYPEGKQELNYLKSLLKGEAGQDPMRMLYFLKRCQQFSGPLTAKGVEDTSFYIYNRLVVHNEVGDSPEHFGITIEEFHQKMYKRLLSFPASVNATATHDTKRGEDARMRLSVLSEIPGEWFTKVEEWKSKNAKIRKDVNIPGDNEEYFIYQTLIAGLPFKEEEDFLTRTCDYLQKVLREAKVHSSWAAPNESYENSVFEFVGDILKCAEFRNSFDPFAKKIAGFGAIKSLSQCIIKVAAPGIPDIYQGTELWDLSYVDPDNRRPVDYEIRKQHLAEFKSYSSDNLEEKLKLLKKDYYSGKIKMYSLLYALQDRKLYQNFYKNAEYLPFEIIGKGGDSFIGFARKLETDWRLIIVPVLTCNLFNYENLEINEDVIKDTYINLPEDCPNEWINILTGKGIIGNEYLLFKDLFQNFPIALLKNKE